eukprot:CAMPEP_0114546400 /NCGR_PEP_ID=MMETSP0114-20121206/3915_1 /TAXON_ID=31324 /ORGANISM="Goniomonas sp, Strain m" /LENGTH=111 /DNA_ID=CAMNT_0001730895 /DNA_START=6 /DNA_END=341 /DNA_ORIENTATION=-
MASKKDKGADPMEETYQVEDETYAQAVEAVKTRSDIDDFERRLEGKPGIPAAKSQQQQRGRPIPKPDVPAAATKIHVGVKPSKKLTEEQEEDLEARRAMAELDAFDNKLPK